MPDLDSGIPQWVSRNPWLWGVIFGLVIAAGVVVISAIKSGLTPALLLLGLVLLIVFGGIALIGAFARRYTTGGPG
jgi:hypothetical protein